MRWSAVADGRCKGLTAEEQPDHCMWHGPSGQGSGEEHSTSFEFGTKSINANSLSILM